MNERSDDPRIEDLLDRWEELSEQGESVTPEELCTEIPELLPVLKKRIEMIESVNALLDVGEAVAKDSDREDSPSTQSTFTGLEFHAKGG